MRPLHERDWKIIQRALAAYGGEEHADLREQVDARLAFYARGYADRATAAERPEVPDLMADLQDSLRKAHEKEHYGHE